MPGDTVAVQYIFRDRDTREAQLTLYLPSSLTRDAALSQALAMVDVLKGISNAAVVSVTLVYKVVFSPAPVPPISSDVLRKAWLFYRNEDNIYEAVAVPSVKGELLAVEGPYTGVALLEPSPAGGLPIGSVEGLVIGTTTAEGQPFPQTYVNGGLIL